MKRRFVDPSYMRKLFEVYFMNDEPLTPDVQGEVDQRDRRHGVRITMSSSATDFGHGLIAPSSIDALTSNSRFLAVNTQSNSANLGYNLITKYQRADYVCIDAPEARLADERPGFERGRHRAPPGRETTSTARRSSSRKASTAA